MKNRRKQRQSRTHAIAWAFLFALAAVAIAAYMCVQGGLRMVDEWTQNLPGLDDTDAFNYAQDSVMYAADGTTMLARFQLEKREPVTIEQVSQYVINGTVDTEDVRFYEHNGADLVGIARAVVNNLAGGSLEGASTITQQLVRNTVLSQEATDITFERKAREIELAVQMEDRYSKDEILMMYLNTINYGDGCYGIEAAAQNYFQVSAIDLSLVQAATLVGIPQSPENLNPKTNPDACLARRNVVLSRMLQAGHISQEEYDAAAAEPLNLNPAPAAPSDGIYNYPHFTSYVRDELLREDNPYGCSYADLFEGGLTIYTTIDPALQDKAEAARDKQLDRMSSDLDAAIVAIDPQNGHVKALVGGKDWSSSKVNLATGSGGSGRQAGSSFKVFALTAAIEAGIDPETLIDCTSPMTITEGHDAGTSIRNFGNINYGTRSIQRATAVSSNTGYIRLTQEIGPAAVAETAHRMGITSELSEVLTLTLGSSSVTPLEMANAYATLASGGIRHDATVITRIENADGEVIYEAPDTAERVLDEDVSGAVTKVLRTVFETDEGTAHGASPSNGQPVAGKTGTSDDFADRWLVGYSPTLSCATWIGHPAGSIETPSSVNCEAMWRDFMSAALDGTPIVQFPETEPPAYDNDFNERQDEALGLPPAEQAAEEEAAEEEERYNDPSTAPNTVGMTLDQAAQALAGYEAGYVEVASDTVPAGTVISQEARDGMVVLTVSTGPAA